ncbi:MAG: hypothetical protein WDW36_010185 [Sanguina aurantia]
MPSCWAGERMGQPPNTHVGGQGRTPASAVMAITLAQATCVRASVGALGVSGAQQRVMEAERHLPVHGDMSLAPVSPSPLAYGQSSTSRPCPRLTSLPMPMPTAQLPFSSDLSAGLLVLSPNLPRGPSPGPQHCPSSRRGCHGPGHSPGYLPTPPWRAGRPTCAVAWNGKGCRT